MYIITVCMLPTNSNITHDITVVKIGAIFDTIRSHQIANLNIWIFFHQLEYQSIRHSDVYWKVHLAGEYLKLANRDDYYSVSAKYRTVKCNIRQIVLQYEEY